MFVYLEGVNHAATLYDTDDIATVRGSSILLERLAEALRERSPILARAECVDRGASQALFRLPEGIDNRSLNDEVQKALRHGAYRHLSIICGIGADAESAQAAARRQQFQLWTVPPPDADAVASDGPDAFDGTRAATLPGPTRDNVTLRLSPSVKERREAGRKTRPHLFPPDRYAAPESFHDLIGRLPSGIPEQVANKLAVIHADGAGAGKLRKAVGDPALFSRKMVEHRAAFARSIEAWFDARGDYGMIRAGEKPVPRFDTLLWGGDDMTFILPAWLALPFIDLFFATARGWTFETVQGLLRMHHRLSCVIADRKTPIRQMITLARVGDEMLKEALGEATASAFTVDVFESSALPYDGLGAYRAWIYGPEYKPDNDFFRPGDGARVMAFCTDAVKVDAEDGEVSATQVHSALEDLRRLRPDDPRPSVIASNEGDESVRKLIASHYRRVKGVEPPFDRWTSDFSAHPRRMSMLLAQAAQLRPYAEAAARAMA